MSQKTAEANKQVGVKVKQADKTDSLTVKKPFDKAAKTAERIVQLRMARVAS